MVKLRRRGDSGNVIDNRGARGLGMPVGMAGGAGVLGLIVVLLMQCMAGGGSGFDFSRYINQLPQIQAQTPGPKSGIATPDPDAEMVDFVSAAFDDIQVTWAQINPNYRDAKMVLFTDATGSACGNATSAVGPFYCPGDQQVYIDLGFFEELANRFGAPGDFAIAYVIAHEVGHHVQTLIGVSDEVNRLSQQNPDDANELSIRQELQADCFAGVWGNTALKRGILENGDLEEGLAAAAAVGDDRLSGEENRESWTHGSSDQRVSWFRRGFDTGNPSNCDTFSGDV